MKKVISVRFKENGKSYYFDPGDAIIHAGEYVIVETARTPNLTNSTQCSMNTSCICKA